MLSGIHIAQNSVYSIYYVVLIMRCIDGQIGDGRCIDGQIGMEDA